MSDVLVGVGAFTAALVMYALGYWAGRNRPEDE
jgi:membrane protein DedA with SNARE-associated domain